VHVAVIAPQRLRQRADAGHTVPVNMAQQLQPLRGQHAGERIPAFKRQMPLMNLNPAVGRSFCWVALLVCNPKLAFKPG
jgi:hypothetical protein